MNPAVSIIIPVYNTEKYLRECLDSVLAQTMTDIEVLCVDDGSTDSSLAILHEYAAKDSRLTVYTQEHQFAGAARNLGIGQARGKYLIFLDSDDLFDPQLVEKSYTRAEETAADICVFGGEIFYDGSGKRRPVPYLCRPDLCPENVFSAKERPEEIFSFTTPGPCNKIFRREFILAAGISFQNTRNCNDLAFVLTALACAERITLLNEPLFSYRRHAASTQHNLDKDPLALYAALRELRRRLIDRGLYEALKDGYTTMAAANCWEHLNSMKTLAAYQDTYAFIRDTAISEYGLDQLPDCAERIYPELHLKERNRDIRVLSPRSFIAKYGIGLRTVIRFGDPILFLRTVAKRLKRC